MARVLCDLWNCDVVKLPRSYRLDYAALRQKRVIGWLELKRRYRNFTDHDRVFLSLQKVLAARELHESTGLSCFFVIQFNDGFFYTDILLQRRVIEFRGRVDRGDWQDQEAVIAIPLSDFRSIQREAK